MYFNTAGHGTLIANFRKYGAFDVCVFKRSELGAIGMPFESGGRSLYYLLASTLYLLLYGIIS